MSQVIEKLTSASFAAFPKPKMLEVDGRPTEPEIAWSTRPNQNVLRPPIRQMHLLSEETPKLLELFRRELSSWWSLQPLRTLRAFDYLHLSGLSNLAM